MNNKYLFITLAIITGLANIATVRKSEDPIRDTQTDAIRYDQKMEEEKDGKKGPLLYSVKYNPRNKFLTEPPLESERETAKTVTQQDALDWWEEPVNSPPDAGEGSLPETGSTLDGVTDTAIDAWPVSEEAAPEENAAGEPPGDSGASDDWFFEETPPPGAPADEWEPVAENQGGQVAGASSADLYQDHSAPSEESPE